MANKTIKATEGFSAYGENKLAMFAGEIAEVEESFADQLIEGGKAEEYAGGGGNAGNIFFINQDPENHNRYVLNATWQQIYDNFVQNIPSFYYIIEAYSEEQHTIGMGIFVSVNKYEGETYEVSVIDPNGNSYQFPTLSSPDDHPFYITD